MNNRLSYLFCQLQQIFKEATQLFILYRSIIILFFWGDEKYMFSIMVGDPKENVEVIARRWK